MSHLRFSLSIRFLSLVYASKAESHRAKSHVSFVGVLAYKPESLFLPGSFHSLAATSLLTSGISRLRPEIPPYVRNFCNSYWKFSHLGQEFPPYVQNFDIFSEILSSAVWNFIPTPGIFYGISYVTLRSSRASYETASVTVSTYAYDYEKPDIWLPITAGLTGALRFTIEFRLELRLRQILFCIRYSSAPSSTN